MVIAFMWSVTGHAQTVYSDQHTEVSMRMIGHQVLLQAGDTVSRVLPVQKEGNGYVIRFEEKFGIDPELMAATIDSVIAATEISGAYIVEVKACGTDEVVYSYEMGGATHPDVIPCRTRALPVGCYAIWVTLMDAPNLENSEAGIDPSPTETEKLSAAFWLLPLMLVLGLLIYLYRNKPWGKTPGNLIAIGEYRFDPKAMTLAFQSERIELTGKESELLHLLYVSANSTVARDLILEKVWGDQGDYVGRTLDVFISKLRKKLEADSRIQIKNIRGVGYKLVLSVV